MNTENFQKYINQPEKLEASTIPEIQEVLLAFPYFQAAHFLYLRALYNQNNFKFNSQLKQSAVHVVNRKKLYYFLKEDHFQIVPLEDTDLTNKVSKVTEIVKEKNNAEKKTPKQKQFTETAKPLENREEKKVQEENERTRKANNKISLNEPKELESDQTKIVTKPSKKPKIIQELESKTEIKTTLSPQEVLARRVAELKKENQEKNTKKEIIELAVNEQKIDTETNSDIKTEGRIDDPLRLQKKAEDFANIDELSEFIQVSAPVEYFIEETTPEKPIIEEPSSTKKTFEDWLSKFQKKHHVEDIKIKKTPFKQIKQENKPPNLIDRFLSDTSPKIIKADNTIPKNSFPEKNDDSDSNFMTETLAQIYIKQKQYQKAKEAYIKLSLKYPKKNSYFASQIEKIKNLQLNS